MGSEVSTTMMQQWETFSDLSTNSQEIEDSISERRYYSSIRQHKNTAYSSLPYIQQLNPVTLEERDKEVRLTVSTVLHLREGQDLHTVNTSVDMNSLDKDLARHFNTVEQLQTLQAQRKGRLPWIRTWRHRK